MAGEEGQEGHSVITPTVCWIYTQRHTQTQTQTHTH
eukprot:COSAG03_NODE_8973_length_755_cov_1.125000_1_plen_35_part_10